MTSRAHLQKSGNSTGTAAKPVLAITAAAFENSALISAFEYKIK